MHGFPFNWNHIVNICKERPSSNLAPLPVSKIEENVCKECSVVQVDDTETGKLSSLEASLKCIIHGWDHRRIIIFQKNQKLTCVWVLPISL